MGLGTWQLIVSGLVGLGGAAVAIVTSVLNHRANKATAERAEKRADRTERATLTTEQRQRKVEAYESFASARAELDTRQPDQRDFRFHYRTAYYKALLVASPEVRAKLIEFDAMVMDAPDDEQAELRENLYEVMSQDILAAYPPHPT